MLVRQSQNTSLPRNWCTPEELQRVIDSLDTNKDGRISREEMENLLLASK